MNYTEHQPEDGLDKPTREKFGALETIKELTPLYAEAKAQCEYLAQFRKSKKAMLMIEAEQKGHKSAVMQERYAYAHQEYIQLLEGYKVAIELSEKYRCTIDAAKIACGLWQTKMASERAERKAF